MSSLLQTELDFSEYDATGEQLVAYWTPRTIRSHRAPLRHAAIKLVTSVAAVLVGASVALTGVAVANRQLGRQAQHSPPMAWTPPEDIEPPAVETTDGVEQVERRGGDRASRGERRRERRVVVNTPTPTSPPATLMTSPAQPTEVEPPAEPVEPTEPVESPEAERDERRDCVRRKLADERHVSRTELRTAVRRCLAIG